MTMSSAPASTDMPFAGVDLGDRAVAAGAQLVLHLHRFDHDERLARADRVAGLDQHADDLARHRRHEALRARPGARRRRPCGPSAGGRSSATATGDAADVHGELAAAPGPATTLTS